MKRLVIAFALVSTAASVASAQLLRSSYAPSALDKPAAGILLPSRTEVAQSPQAAKPTPTLPASALVARQAPVPMQPRSRSSVFVPPAVVPASAQTSTVATTSDGTPADTILGGLTEGDARAAIEADGYRKARVVSKTADGTWRARALRGATEVSLRVDAQGNVMVD